jgi:hypothetical protein
MEIHIEETLTKPNFWDELYAKYPKGTQIFCKWIDAYKKEVGWNQLFNSDSEYQNAAGKNAPAPKFHDLPHAMQMGIWFAFMRDRGGCQWTIEDMFSYDLREDIAETVMQILEVDAEYEGDPS